MKMNWKGRPLKTFGDILDAVVQCGSREEAQEFMRLYRAEYPLVADVNIGYLGGHCSDETNRRIQDWFGSAPRMTQPVTCARCQQPMKRGAWQYLYHSRYAYHHSNGRIYRGTSHAEPVHCSAARCAAALNQANSKEGT